MTKNYDDFRAGMLRAAEMARDEFKRAPEAAKGHDCVYMGGYEDACDHLVIAQAAVIDSVRIAGSQPDWQYHIALLLPDGAVEDQALLKIYQVVEHELRSLQSQLEQLRAENVSLRKEVANSEKYQAQLLDSDSQATPASAAPVVDNLQHRLYEECVTANWDPERKNTFAEEIAHLHEELSEAFRAWRRYKDCEVREVNGKLEGVPIEFADALIGMFYNAELYGFDLLAAVERKHQFNLNRNYVAEGRQLHAAAAVHPPQKVGIIRLYDRADGVKGHYCIGRLRTDGTNEFWNKDKFCSAGEVFIGKELAEAKLSELAATAAPQESDTRPSCWHCGVVLAYPPKLRCEDCPDECDVEGCDELGCAPTKA